MRTLRIIGPLAILVTVLCALPAQAQAQAQESSACTVGEWNSWSKCSVACGGGTQTRTRAIASGGSGSAKCPPLVETKKCNGDACAAPACIVSAWGAWSACTHPCGGGMRTRTRKVRVAPPSGAECPPLSEAGTCNTQACPK